MPGRQDVKLISKIQNTNADMSTVSQRRSLPCLTASRITVRFAQPDDVPVIVEYYTTNRVFLTPWEPKHPEEFFTEAFWVKEVRDRLQGFQLGQSAKFFLCEHTSAKRSKIIGSINASNIIRGAFQACNLGYSLAQDKQHQGYMTEAFSITIPYLFEELNLHRIMANYMPHNLPSGKLLKRFGFVVEGYAKNYLQINGHWEDHILTSLTNSAWKQLP